MFGLLLTKSSCRFNSSKNILPTHISWLSCDQTCYVRATSVGASVEWIVKSKATMGLDLIPVWLSNIVWLKVTDYISKVRDVFWRWWDQYEGRIFKILLVHLMCLKLLNCLPQNLICCFSNNRQNLMRHVFCVCFGTLCEKCEWMGICNDQHCLDHAWCKHSCCNFLVDCECDKQTLPYDNAFWAYPIIPTFSERLTTF